MHMRQHCHKECTSYPTARHTCTFIHLNSATKVNTAKKRWKLFFQILQPHGRDGDVLAHGPWGGRGSQSAKYDILDRIRSRSLRYFGHVVRIPYRALYEHVHGNRPMQRNAEEALDGQHFQRLPDDGLLCHLSNTWSRRQTSMEGIHKAVWLVWACFSIAMTTKQKNDNRNSLKPHKRRYTSLWSINVRLRCWILHISLVKSAKFELLIDQFRPV